MTKNTMVIAYCLMPSSSYLLISLQSIVHRALVIISSRLQSEASRQIAELAERAHNEAVVNLDETTRNIYRENVRLTESLSLHMKV